ncbi:nitroreductase family protein [Streptomyces sp. NPDC047108]|uniref:nitroreductase family protein n=1 Tax=Streptomyces sp. NPDC047108 TaxID=3155025 RepID=UPI0033D2E0D9
MPLIDLNRLTEDLLLSSPQRRSSRPGTGRTAPSVVPPALPGDAVGALRARAAVRQWASGAFDGARLLRALRHASEQDRQWWGPAFPELPSPVAAVLAQRVDGVAAGYHHYAPATGELAPQPYDPPPVRDLVLQLEFAEAPVVIVVLGDLAAAVDRYGTHGHRLLLARGAAFAHAVWLAGLSEGAAGTVFAGVLSSAGRTELGIDGFRRAQLLGLALGDPVDAAPPVSGGRPVDAVRPAATDAARPATDAVLPATGTGAAR